MYKCLCNKCIGRIIRSLTLSSEFAKLWSQNCRVAAEEWLLFANSLSLGCAVGIGESTSFRSQFKIDKLPLPHFLLFLTPFSQTFLKPVVRASMAILSVFGVVDKTDLNTDWYIIPENTYMGKAGSQCIWRIRLNKVNTNHPRLQWKEKCQSKDDQL